MATTVNAKVVFKDLCKSVGGYNYTEYDDVAIFDTNINNFTISYKLDKAKGTITLVPNVQDYRKDRDYGEEKDMV